MFWWNLLPKTNIACLPKQIRGILIFLPTLALVTMSTNWALFISASWQEHDFIVNKYPYLLTLLNILIKGWDTCQAALCPLPHWKSAWQFLGFKMSQGTSSEEFQGWSWQGRNVRGQFHIYWKLSGFSSSVNPWKNYIWDTDYFEKDSEGILGSKATNT